MSDRSPEPDDLRKLGQRIEEMRSRKAARSAETPPTMPGTAFRFATEMVAALVVGGGIGWGLDRLFGTRPIFLIVFFMLGAAAGIRNVMRAARELNAQAKGPE